MWTGREGPSQPKDTTDKKDDAKKDGEWQEPIFIFYRFFFLNFQKTRGSKDEDLKVKGVALAQWKSLRVKDKKSRDLILSLGKKEKEALNIFFIWAKQLFSVFKRS